MQGIVCFGDSITFGRGETPNKSWCGRLKDFLEVKESHNGVYNLGVPGHTSADLLQRFDVEADGRIRIKRPEDKFLILIAIGTNDCKWDGVPEENKERMSAAQFTKNITTLIAKATGKQAKVAFIGLPSVDESRTSPFDTTYFKNERVQQFNDIIMKQCEVHNIPFLNMFEAMPKESNLLADGLHPNSKGYDFMFEIIKEFLEKNTLI